MFNVFLIIVIILLNIILIRKMIFNLYIDKFKFLSLEFAKYFIEESKKKEFIEIDDLKSLHYQTSLINIYLFNLGFLKRKKIFFNIKQLKKDLYFDLFKIYVITKNKDFDFNYFLMDFALLQIKDKKSIELRLNVIFELFKFNHNCIAKEIILKKLK